jgi:hypothetical protein
MRMDFGRAAAATVVAMLAVAATGLPNAARGDVKVEKIQYLNLPNCYRLSNGTVEVVVTTDVGPRIIRYAFVKDGENILAEIPDTVVKTDLGEWKPLGGHRLWSAPEAWPRSYAPDNGPVEYRMEGANAVRLMQPVEEKTGLQKELIVSLESDGTGVTITHRLTNRNPYAIDVACWGLTIMNGGGTTIIPQEPYISHDDNLNGLVPARKVVLWHFTDMTDPRWTFGKQYLRLKTDENIKEAQKIGVANKRGWAAYHRKDTLFVKRFAWDSGATYPDDGCNNETYTSANFMELETLAPMRHLQWGETAEHVERWNLFRGVDIGATEATLDAAVQPLVTPLLGK